MIELVRHIYDTSSYPMFFIFFTVVMAFILFYAILDNLTKMISSMCSTIGHFAKNKKTKSEKERMRDLLHKEQELVMVWTEIGDALKRTSGWPKRDMSFVQKCLFAIADLKERAKVE